MQYFSLYILYFQLEKRYGIKVIFRKMLLFHLTDYEVQDKSMLLDYKTSLSLL